MRITGAACIGSFLLGTGKLLAGLMALSFFTCVSAFYTYGMVIAKLCALKGLTKPRAQQYAYYRSTGLILIAASVCYGIYAARLLHYPENTQYDLYTGITIATITFAEITVNCRGVAVERKNKALLFHALKMVNLAASLISLVLTQTALLSFSQEKLADYNPSSANGIMGMLMGGVSALIGCYMLLRVRRIQAAEAQQGG